VTLPAEESASHLCTSCGLCCSGVVLSGVLLRTEAEVAWATRHRLPVVETPRGPAFPHPCAMLSERRCSDYDGRPGACRKFSCKTLNGFVEGTISREQADARVQELQLAVQRIESKVPADQRSMFWRHAALAWEPSLEPALRQSSELYLGEALEDVRQLRRAIDDWIVSPAENARGLDASQS
jgi:hypothetical protein